MNKIAVLGPEGTFSDCAYQKYAEEKKLALSPVYYPSIEETFGAVGTACTYAIVPLENTLDGYVQLTLDLFLERSAHILSEVYVPVQFSAAANASDLSGVKRLYVQFKAKGQCRKFISSLKNVVIVTTESNMESYRLLKEGIPGDAAIIPRHIYDRDEAPFGIANVTDSENNFTRFVAIAPGERPETALPPSGIKVTMYVIDAADKPGELFEILREFSVNHINLISIMSRPTKKSMGKYNFFLELRAHPDEKNVIDRTVERLRRDYHIKILGIYSARG